MSFVEFSDLSMYEFLSSNGNRFRSELPSTDTSKLLSHDVCFLSASQIRPCDVVARMSTAFLLYLLDLCLVHQNRTIATAGIENRFIASEFLVVSISQETRQERNP